jgi:hypothetical protein
VLLDEKRETVKSVSYCDDGIMYGDDSGDFYSILQELFDTNDAGVMVHPDKSG